MSSKRYQLTSSLLAILLFSGVGLVQQAQAAEILTLFTTPEERQIINSNRYKSDEKPVKPVAIAEQALPDTAMQQLIMEEVSHSYRVSGITLSRDGPHTVWINSAAYQDGDQLEDRSKIRVLVGKDIRVRITAPDGKNYFAKSGEALEITYLAPVEN